MEASSDVSDGPTDSSGNTDLNVFDSDVPEDSEPDEPTDSYGGLDDWDTADHIGTPYYCDTFSLLLLTVTAFELVDPGYANTERTVRIIAAASTNGYTSGATPIVNDSSRRSRGRNPAARLPLERYRRWYGRQAHHGLVASPSASNRWDVDHPRRLTRRVGFDHPRGERCSIETLSR